MKAMFDPMKAMIWDQMESMNDQGLFKIFNGLGYECEFTGITKTKMMMEKPE